MNIRTATITVAISALFSCLPHAAFGQGMAPNGITMAVYPVERGPDGAQYIITPRGAKVTVPGLGIDPNANQISVYRDMENHFWYVNRSGLTQPVSEEQLQWVGAQVRAQTAGMQNQPVMPVGGMPMGGVQGQPMPYQQPPQQNVTINQAAPAPSSGGMGALGTGVAAAGGAMLGSMVGSSMYNSNPAYASGYHGVPYGVPMSMEGNKAYYSNSSGAKVYVAPTTNNAAAFDQWNHQASAYQASGYHPDGAYPQANQYHPQSGAYSQSGYHPPTGAQSAASEYHPNGAAAASQAHPSSSQYGQMQSKFQQQEHSGAGAQSAEKAQAQEHAGGRFGGLRRGGGGGEEDRFSGFRRR